MIREYLFRGKCEATGNWAIGSYIESFRKGHWHIIQDKYTNQDTIVNPDTVSEMVPHKHDGDFKYFVGDIGRAFIKNSSYQMQDQSQEEKTGYLVLTWIPEWSLYGWLTVDEYFNYTILGVEDLDEGLFWTYNVGTESIVMLDGNIWDNSSLLEID